MNGHDRRTVEIHLLGDDDALIARNVNVNTMKSIIFDKESHGVLGYDEEDGDEVFVNWDNVAFIRVRKD